MDFHNNCESTGYQNFRLPHTKSSFRIIPWAKCSHKKILEKQIHLIFRLFLIDPANYINRYGEDFQHRGI